MDYLWTPWRFHYVSNIKSTDKCVFCIDPTDQMDEEKYILFRGKFNFVILNIFPYTSGHLLVVPYVHVANLTDCSLELSCEMMELAKVSKSAIDKAYHPDGFNLGMNLGRCAGAGVEHHLHLHVVPRWLGDSNFMSITGESRVLPETLTSTYQKLKQYFQ